MRVLRYEQDFAPLRDAGLHEVQAKLANVYQTERSWIELQERWAQ